MRTPDVEILLKTLPEYKAEKTLVTRRQDTFDIIREIMKVHRLCVEKGAYDRIAEYHWQNDPVQTARGLFTFAKHNLPYYEEKTLQQTVKEPQAILAERLTFGNDCKHYACYIVGILEALRRKGYPINCFYRFASYNPNKRTPAHVFAVMVHNGEEYWIDPVPQVGGFNSRNIRPYFTTDKMPPMSKNGNSIGSLYRVSGIEDNNGIGRHRGRGHWLDRAIDSPLNPLHPGVYMPGSSKILHLNKHHGHGHHNFAPHFSSGPHHIGGGWLDDFYGTNGMGKAKKHQKHHGHRGLHLKIKPGQLLKKVSLAPSRNAFLLYIKLNLFHTGSKLYAKIAHNPEAKKKLLDAWTKLGGDNNKLMTALTQAMHVWNAHHKAHKITGADEVSIYGPGDSDGDQVGVAQVAIPAVLAAAAPIIAALSNLLKSFGIKHPSKGETDKADMDAAQDHNEATEEKGDGNKDVNPDGSVDHGNGVTSKVDTDPQTGQQRVTYDVKDPTGSGGVEADAPDKGPGSSITKGDSQSSFGIMMHNVTSFISDHKWWFIGGTAAIVSLIVIPKLISHKKTRRR